MIIFKSFICTWLLFSALSYAQNIDPTQSMTEHQFINGAETYLRYCSLCHGNQGMGEGMLPSTLDEYPNTNLMTDNKLHDRKTLRRGIAEGHEFSDKEISRFMPPWKDELTLSELDNTAGFVQLLQQFPAEAERFLAQASEKVPLRKSQGTQFFKSRCALCHGTSGTGDGRMAKILTSPKPANLTVSQLNTEEMNLIISEGGQAVGRSPSMPPWKDQLSKQEILAIIEFIKTL